MSQLSSMVSSSSSSSPMERASTPYSAPLWTSVNLREHTYMTLAVERGEWGSQKSRWRKGGCVNVNKWQMRTRGDAVQKSEYVADVM